MECAHPIQVGGLCAICGKDLEAEGASQGETFATLHSSAQVKVSKEEAERIDRESTNRLLGLRKLALIVDLDQTLIHVTVDPTVADWARDVHNPNWPALRDIVAFQLGPDGCSVTHEPEVLHSYDASAFATGGEENGCWYYVKLRPGVNEFLAFLAERYELHVYTMGTRSYAECICTILDPSGHLFGSRILSRDENENMLQKSLSRLFPTNTSMAVIIDDRADVWNWSPNLIKVQPYEFFIGIGDINAAYLPTGNEAFTLPNKAVPEPDEKEAPSPEAQSKAKHADKTHRQVISEQMDSRPLKRRQEELKGRQGTGHRGHEQPTHLEHGEVAEENEKPSAPEPAEHDDGAGENGYAKHDTKAPVSEAPEQAAHEDAADPASEAVLHDEDQELPLVRSVLDKVHSQWYAAWEKQSEKGADVPLPEAKVRLREANFTHMQDIVSSLKSRVLAGCHLAFSGLIPQGQPPEFSPIWRMAEEYGATCHEQVNRALTHLVTANAGTIKAEEAFRLGNIEVVHASWLHESICQWQKQDAEEHRVQRNERLAGAPLEEVQASLAPDQPPPEPGLLEDLPPDDGLAGMDWGEAEDEVDAFLEDDDEDDEDSASNASDVSNDVPESSAGARRKHGASEEGGEDQDLLRSPLSKRRRLAALRGGRSRLRQSFRPDDDEAAELDAAGGEDVSAPPSQPDTPATPKEVAGLRSRSATASDDEHFLDDLAVEMERELGDDEAVA